MCEFCNLPGSNSNRDQQHSDFAGFFSADAINLAVQQANTSRRKGDADTEEDDDDDASGDGEDDDGT